MALLKIITYGHPTLRKIAEPVKEITDDIIKLADDMIDTMQVADGIGLAAPQVNKSIRMIVIGMDLIDEDLEPRAFINPEIIESSSDTEIMEEGCLSIPGIREDVERPVSIKVKFRNLDGAEEVMEADGLLARVFMHEIDHLNGVMFVDKISPIKKKLVSSKLHELQQMATSRA
ncbi:MAG: peptide deformylase [Calditrichia bacterium]